MENVENDHLDFEGWLEEYINLNKINLQFPFDFFNVFFSYFCIELKLDNMKNESNFRNCTLIIKNSLAKMLLHPNESFGNVLIKEVNSSKTDSIPEVPNKTTLIDFGNNMSFGSIEKN